MRQLHLLGGPLDSIGGVTDYTSVLAGALSSRGVTAHIWDATEPGARRRLREVLAQTPAPVLVQYVPNAFGWRGANLGFCAWLLSLRREGHDVRVMFHEPYFYFGIHPLRNGLAVVQRLMAAMILRAAAVCYVSTDTWIRYLSPYAPRGTRFVTLPVPATIARRHDQAAEHAVRTRLLAEGTSQLVGHFGTFGDHVGGSVAPILSQLLRERADVTVICAGRGSEAFVERLRKADPHTSARLAATGTLAGEEVAAVLRACDVVVQPYPDGVTTRRTSVMAALANGVATVTSDGFLTERLWTQSDAVSMAPALDPGAHVREIVALLDDDARRLERGARAVEFYDAHCSIEVTVDVLLGGELAATA